MSGALADTRAVITGAGQGIGRAIAETFAREGATIFLAEINRATGEEVAACIGGRGGVAHYVEADVANPDSVGRLADKIRELGGDVDVLVNNAGLGGMMALTDTSDQAWRTIMDVNLRGVFLVSRAFLPDMLRRRTGSIVNIASIYSFVGDRHAGAYAASKGGVLMLTRAMAVDYAAAGIRVNAVCPGFVSGPMADRENSPEELAALAARHPTGRLVFPEEVAQTTLFLAGDGSSAITGSCIAVDGGYLAA